MREIVRLTSQVLTHLAFGKGAELALEVTHIGVINIPVNAVGHFIAGKFLTEPICGLTDCNEIITSSLEQAYNIRFTESFTLFSPGKDRGQIRHGRGTGNTCHSGQVGFRWRFNSPCRPFLRSCETRTVDGIQHMRLNQRIGPFTRFLGVGGIKRQTFNQQFTSVRRFIGQVGQVRPGGLRIDKIRSHRGHSTPIIDPCINNLLEHTRREVGWRLNIHRRTENDSCHGNGPEQFIQVGFRRINHQGVRFSPEILNNDLLDMAIGLIGVTQRQERLQSLVAGFTDTYQDARGKRYGCFTRQPQSFKPTGRHFVRRSVMGHALFCQPVRRALEHNAHRQRDLAELCELVGRQQARIQVREEPCFIKDELRHIFQIGQRRLLTEFLEPLTSSLVT